MINQGIAATVDDKVDAYRANPDALAQRAKGSQDLLDLLALQQVNKEKEAAKRQIQLNTQPPQDTILAQLEAEAVGRTKEDMVNQIGGIMQKDNQAQAKNMQRVGKEGAATPQQLASVQQGLGQVAGQINPNIARARAGGIVGFSNGGLVQDIQDAIVRRDKQKLIDLGGYTLEMFGDNPDAASIAKVVREKGRQSGFAEPPTKTSSVEEQPPVGRQSFNPGPIKIPKLAASKGIPSVLEGGETLEERTSKVFGLGDKGIAGFGPKAQEQAGLEAVQKYETDANLKENRENLRRLQAERADPQARDRDRFIAGLLGASGRASTALAGAGAASMQYRQRAADDEYNVAAQLAGLDRQTSLDMATISQNAKDGMAQRQKTYAEYLRTITEAEYRRAVAEMSDQTQRDIENARNEVAKIEQEMLNLREAETSRRMSQRDKMTYLDSALERVQTLRAALQANILEEFKAQRKPYIDRLSQLVNATTDEDIAARKALNDDIAKLDETARTQMMAANEIADLIKQEEAIVAEMERTVEGSQSFGPVEVINPR